MKLCGDSGSFLAHWLREPAQPALHVLGAEPGLVLADSQLLDLAVAPPGFDLVLSIGPSFSCGSATSLAGVSQFADSSCFSSSLRL